ncbi:DUF309 domain-containing protein [Sphaerisporangium aureirubrum]|uniref:DUF309 domain-containing protein n=1 Tax=Sphaerisporangium aureirubrum TaxID=1544736 RepID=A0ABW1NTT3_9ACTN
MERVPDDYAPGPDEALALAARYLSEGRPFHAHEVLEARWKTGPEGERDLWQGLAQICVGLTHLQRGNSRGAAALLTRGADRVARYSGAPIDVVPVVRLAGELAGPGTPDLTGALDELAALLAPGARP